MKKILIGLFAIPLFTASVNAAEPSYNPPGNAVSPTFDSVTVQNNANLERLTVDDNAVFNGPVSISTLLVRGVLELENALRNGINDNVPVVVDDSFRVKNASDVNPVSNNAAFKIGVNDNQWLGIDTNEIVTKGGPLYLNHDSDQDVIIGKKIKSSRGPLVIGNLELNEEWSYDNATRNNVAINGKVDARAGIVNTYGNGILAWSDAVHIRDSLYVDEDTHVNADLEVLGTLTANQIGSYYRIRSANISVAPNTGNTTNQLCPFPRQVVVACNVKPVSNGAALRDYAGLSAYADEDLNYCQGKMFNSNAAAAREYIVETICFDPTGEEDIVDPPFAF